MASRNIIVIRARQDDHFAANLVHIVKTQWASRVMDKSIEDVIAMAASEGSSFDSKQVLLLMSPMRSAEAMTGRLAASLRSSRLPNPIIVATDATEPDLVMALLEAGAIEYLLPPFERAHVIPRLQRFIVENVADAANGDSGVKGLIGRSPAFVAEVRMIPIIANCDVAALILGETGTGKELCARAIHYLSSRVNGPFVPVNCGAIPGGLAENELFGHESGAFTGATKASSGLIHQAEGGTLFLDEIDSLPLSVQVMLLRFLQDKEYRQLGSQRTLKANVRILAAANGNIAEGMQSGRFRKDFYYRLSLVTFSLPSLRERVSDIPLLAQHFLRKFAIEYHKPVTGFGPQALHALINYAWPGNVRELENVVGRSVLLAQTPVVHDVDLPSDRASDPLSFKTIKARAVAEFERKYLADLLAAHDGNITQAANAAQKDRRAFWELLRKHKMSGSNEARHTAR